MIIIIIVILSFYLWLCLVLSETLASCGFGAKDVNENR